jgi:hypothetical protein
MVNSLKEGGWRDLAPGALPAAVANALGMYTVEMALVSMRALPMVFLVPVMLVPTPDEVLQ